jgi:hypothetical protein
MAHALKTIFFSVYISLLLAISSCESAKIIYAVTALILAYYTYETRRMAEGMSNRQKPLKRKFETSQRLMHSMQSLGSMKGSQAAKVIKCDCI